MLYTSQTIVQRKHHHLQFQEIEHTYRNDEFCGWLNGVYLKGELYTYTLYIIGEIIYNSTKLSIGMMNVMDN